MTPSALKDIPSWEWPPVARESIKKTLQDPVTPMDERLAAVDVAGDLVVMDDEMADLLLAVLLNPGESEDLRARAAISLGPALEDAFTNMYDDPDFPASITEPKFDEIRETLRSLFADEGLGKELRRRILEASVRAHEPWHVDAVRAAAASPDEDWKLTAAFAMRFVPGFEDEILEMLESSNPEIYFEAIQAAGDQQVEGAWPHIAAVLATPNIDQNLLVAAIEAAPWVNPEEAVPVLTEFLDSDDDDIVAAAQEALAHAQPDDPDYEIDDAAEIFDEFEEDEGDDGPGNADPEGTEPDGGPKRRL